MENVGCGERMSGRAVYKPAEGNKTPSMHATAVINYLSQDLANYSIVLTCLYYCFQQQYANDTITLPPSVNPSDKHALSFGTSKVLRLPPNVIHWQICQPVEDSVRAPVRKLPSPRPKNAWQT